MISIFLVGPPGVGKTSLVRELLGKEPWLVQKPKWTVGTVIAAGHYVGGTYDGADTVPYNGVAQALAYWKQHLFKEEGFTVFDGDRFSHEKALAEIRAASKRVLCIHVDADAAVLATRRALRGSDQNASWMKGRETKAKRFTGLFDVTEVKRLYQPGDARARNVPPAEWADTVRHYAGMIRHYAGGAG